MAVGDLVATLSVPGIPSATFTLASNPGGFFAISGSNLIEAINTPAGNYPISLTANGMGVSITQPFNLIFAGSPSPNIILDISQQSNVELFPGML